METSVVKTYDPPAASVPETSRYERAQQLRYDLYLKACMLSKRQMWATGFCMILTAVVLLDDIQGRHELREIAKYKPAYVIERGMDGHQRKVAIDELQSRPEATRKQTVQWFVTWMRRRAWDKDDRGMLRDQAEAQARLVNGMQSMWDTLMKTDPESDVFKAGGSRDVTSMKAALSTWDESHRAGIWDVVWTEVTYDKNRNVTGNGVYAIRIVTIDGDMTDNVMDGVYISQIGTPARMDR
jgi:hypothetical protein